MFQFRVNSWVMARNPLMCAPTFPNSKVVPFEDLKMTFLKHLVMIILKFESLLVILALVSSTFIQLHNLNWQYRY